LRPVTKAEDDDEQWIECENWDSIVCCKERIEDFTNSLVTVQNCARDHADQICRRECQEHIGQTLTDLSKIPPGQHHTGEVAEDDMRRRHSNFVNDAGKAKRF